MVECKPGYWPAGSRMTRAYACSSSGTLTQPNLRCNECSISNPGISLLIRGPHNRTQYASEWLNVDAKGVAHACQVEGQSYMWTQTVGPVIIIPRPSKYQLSIPSYTFIPGTLYCFKVEYGARGVQAGLGDWSGSANAHICVDVLARDVSAKIRGGDRLVSAARDFILDGSESKDPEKRGSNRFQVSHRWRCERVSNSTIPCFAGVAPLSMTASKLVVPANSLAGGEDYLFYLDVTSDLGSRSKTARVRVTASLNPTILVQVELHTSAVALDDAGVSLIDPNRAVVMTAAFGYEADLRLFSTYSFVWSCSGINLSGTNSFFRIPALTLSPGSDTKCQVRVTDASGSRTGRADVRLRSRSPPVGGTCSVNPANGTDLDFDHYSFQCSKWYLPDDLASNNTLWYRFALTKQSANGRLKDELLLSEWAQDPQFVPSVLPAGKSQDGYRRNVRAYVRDSNLDSGATSTFDFSVVVRPASVFSSNETDVEEVSQTIIDQQLLGSVENGDLGAAAQISATIVDMLSSRDQGTTSGNGDAVRSRTERNKKLKTEILAVTKNAIVEAETQTGLEQGAALLRVVAGVPEEVSANVSDSVINCTLAILKTVTTNELAVSPNMAQDLLAASSSIAYADSPGPSASSSNDRRHRADRANSFSSILNQVSRSLATQIVPGENSTVTSGETTLLTQKNYATQFRNDGATFGDQGADQAKFVLSAGVFQNGNLSTAVTVETRFFRMKADVFSFADENNSTNSDVVVFSIHGDSGDEIKVNGTSPIDITIPSTQEIPNGDSRSRVCRYFDKRLQSWSTAGCEFKESHARSTVCRCTHLTAFSTALLNDVPPQAVSGSSSDENGGSQDYTLVIIGCVVAACLVVIIIVGMWMWKWTGNHRQRNAEAAHAVPMSPVIQSGVEGSAVGILRSPRDEDLALHADSPNMISPRAHGHKSILQGVVVGNSMRRPSVVGIGSSRRASLVPFSFHPAKDYGESNASNSKAI